MSQTRTGKLAEERVREKLESMGLEVYKPIPDYGIDLTAHSPEQPQNVINIQVKGRNPQKDPNLRWFQIRVSPSELIKARDCGIPANRAWMVKVDMVDFFVLVAIRAGEMWVLNRDQVYELIELNEHRYGRRPDNIFEYGNPLKQKQKELNLDIEVNGRKLTEKFKTCKDNFRPILELLHK